MFWLLELLYKYKRLAVIIVLLIALVLGIQLYLFVYKKSAIEEHEAKVTTEVNNQVKKDESDIKDNYTSPASDAINYSVDSLLKKSGSTVKLPGIGQDTFDAKRHSKKSPDLGAQDGLYSIGTQQDQGKSNTLCSPEEIKDLSVLYSNCHYERENGECVEVCN